MTPPLFVSQIGEFGLIERIRKWVREPKGTAKGIGDDAAVLRWDEKSDLLFTTDMLVEGRHFRLSEATAFEIGWKAMAVNLSDIAAMGGEPRQAVVALGLPRKLSVAFVRELYRGMEAVGKRFGAGIAGGDTNRSGKLIISVALLGRVDKGKATLRSGARPGDAVFVSGRLGGSYRSGRHLRFVPRVKEARFLTRRFQIHAMMDVSDGLASDIRRLAEASAVGVRLFSHRIPLSSGVSGVAAAMNDGEDFELLFTLSETEARRLERTVFPKGLAPFHRIGKVTDRKEGLRLVGAVGKVETLRATSLQGGYDHFRKPLRS